MDAFLVVSEFNGDHMADILWRNSDGTITDWLGQANGGFQDNSALASQPLDLSLQIAGVGDFNGDGKADVLLEWSDGSLQTWVGASSGAIQSPMEKQWWDAFIGAQQLMAEMTTLAINAAAQAGHNIPTPQIDDMSGEQSAAIADMWYMQNPSMWPNARSQSGSPGAQQVADIANYVATHPGSNVQIHEVEGGGFTATVDGQTISLTPIDATHGTYNFHINGTNFYAHWTPPGSTAPLPDASTITVTGTRWDPRLYIPSGLEVIGAENGYHPYDRFGGMGAMLGREFFHFTNVHSASKNAAALAIGSDIKNLLTSKGQYEYGGMISKLPDGSYDLYGNDLSTIFSSGDDAFDNLPSYSEVVGLLHNHVADTSNYMSNFLQRYPSQRDWEALDIMASKGADSNNLPCLFWTLSVT